MNFYPITFIELGSKEHTNNWRKREYKKKEAYHTQLTLGIENSQNWKIDQPNYVKQQQSLHPIQNSELSNYIPVAKQPHLVYLPLPDPNSIAYNQAP